MPLELRTALTYVKGIGPVLSETLGKKGLRTVEDLLAYAPFRYDDRSNVKTIAKLAPGERAAVLAEVSSSGMVNLRRRNFGLFEAVFQDGSGQRLIGKWFNGKYLQDRVVPGVRWALFGKVELDNYTGGLLMINPELETWNEDDPDHAIHLGHVVPVYEATGKIGTRQFRTWMHRILQDGVAIPDALPPSLRERFGFPTRSVAVRQLHFPDQDDDLQVLNAFRSPAQRRLIFEEFFWLECGLVWKKKEARTQPGIPFALKDSAREKIKAMLPFKPTGSQLRVLKEIAGDMKEPSPMYRLLQGDVGSGKTIVAAQAGIIALENGYQIAVLAPTEILASQHYLYFRSLFSKLGYVVDLLTGSATPREKEQKKKLLRAGLVHVAVGTHALLEGNVEFARLGLAIIDEQHRFGVMQRMKLLEKGAHPDVLVMTATPIPRTLALTLYGDLTVSKIDELPPGRQPILTRHATEDQVERVYSFLQEQVELGRQAYVVYPLIEESETASMKAAAQMHKHLSEAVFPQFRIGLLHGKLKSEEKESVMDLFRRKELSILVSTTVIEVGVDVPNATVMVIEQAERFGLAQLHQLRGRVGRGTGQSYCILVTDKLNDAGKERIRTMVESNDGFHIAEMDMRLRGPGEFFGTKQSGLPSFQVANLLRDQEILEDARTAAESFLENGPEPEKQKALEYLQRQWEPRHALGKVG